MFLFLCFTFTKSSHLFSVLFSINAACITVEKSVEIKSLYSVYFAPSGDVLHGCILSACGRRLTSVQLSAGLHGVGHGLLVFKIEAAYDSVISMIFHLLHLTLLPLHSVLLPLKSVSTSTFPPFHLATPLPPAS